MSADRSTPPREETEVMDEVAGGETETDAALAMLAGDGRSRYVPIDELARGGMGTILRVWDRVLRRMAAMKVLRTETPEGESHGTVTRFLREARIAGRLAHPGVVPIYDLDATRDGQVSFSMSLIEGRTLEEVFALVHADDPDWTMARCLQVVIKVCEVIAYAHSRGVIHRDLKPANVMVGEFGEAYVVDWGLAKVMPREADEHWDESRERLDSEDESLVELQPAPGETVDGSVFGTPSFMPPEQAEGRLEQVNELSDVYSIGAILYNLLTGRKPYATGRDSKPAGKTLELVRRGPPTRVSRLRPKTPAELVSICEKAMARDPSRRYASVDALAADLRAFTENRVVEAYERGFFAEAKKLVVRNWPLATLIGALVLVIALAMTIVTVEHTRANRRLEANNEELREARRVAVEKADEARAMAEEAERREHRERLGNYLSSVTAASMAASRGDLATAQRLLDNLAPDLWGWEANHLATRLDGSVARWDPSAARVAESGEPAALAAAPDGGVLLGFADGTLVESDAAVHDVSRALAPVPHEVRGLVVRDGGQWVAAVHGGNLLVLSSLESGEVFRRLELDEPVVALAASGSGLVVALEGGGLARVEPDGERTALAGADGSVLALAATDDVLAASVEGGGLLLLDPRSGERRGSIDLAGELADAVALSADGREVAAGTRAGEVAIWSTDEGELLEVSGGHDGKVTVLFHDPVRHCFVSGGEDGVLVVHRRGALDDTFRGHRTPITHAAVLAGGTRYATRSRDGAVRIWDARGAAQSTRLDAGDVRLACGSFAADGEVLLLGACDGYLLRYDARTGRRTAATPCDPVDDLLPLDGERILVASLGGRTSRVDLGGAVAEPFAGEGGTVLAIDAGAERVVTGCGDGAIRAYRADGTLERELPSDAGPVLALDVASDGDRVVASYADGSVWVLGLDDGERRPARPAGPTVVRALAWDPAGERVAFADEAGLVMAGPPSGGSELVAGREEVTALAWSPDGSRVAAGSVDGTLRVWDVEQQEPVFVERHGPSSLVDVAFDPRGGRLLAVGSDGQALVYETGGALERLEAFEQAQRTGEPPPDLPLPALSDGRGPGDVEARRLRARVLLAEELCGRSWDLVSAAGANPAEGRVAVELARRAARLVDSDPWLEATLGAALVGAGLAPSALERLQRAANELHAERRSTAQAWLALALCESGSAEDARALLERLDEDAPKDVVARLERCLGGGE